MDIMAYSRTLKDKSGVTVYPKTITDSVFDGNGAPLTERLEEVNQLRQDVTGLGEYEEATSFVRVVTDENNKILVGIKNNGDIFFGAGVPEQVAEQLLSKVDKQEGKALSSNDYTDIDSEIVHRNELVDSIQYSHAVLDSNDKIIECIKSDGSKEINVNLKINADLDIHGENHTLIENPELLEAKTDANNKLIEGITVDGKKHISDFDDETKETIRSFCGSSAGIIEIPLLDKDFSCPVPVKITGVKGEADAKYEFDLPLEDAFNIRFKFRITENLLNKGKDTVIASLGSASAVTATSVQLYQPSNLIDVPENGTITEYSFSMNGGISLNGGSVQRVNWRNIYRQNIGNFAFYIKYIGDGRTVTISNDGSEFSLSVDGTTENYLYSEYPSVPELVAALAARTDLEIDVAEIEGRSCSELAIISIAHLTSDKYRNINGGKSDTPKTLYFDAAPVFIPFAVSDRWHQVEIVKIGNNVYSSCDGHILSINHTGNTLVLGGDCEVFFKDLVIRTLDSGDAEYISKDGTSWLKDSLISSANPCVLVYEGHNILPGASYSHVAEDNIGATVDRLQNVFSYLTGKGYVPISIVDIADYYDGIKSLPKRCFTVIYDDYEFANCVVQKYRAVHTRFGIKPALAIVTGYGNNITLDDGTVVDIKTATDLCRKYDFIPVTHSRDHRFEIHKKDSDYMSEFAADILDCDKKGVNGNIMVYPYGAADNYLQDTLQWMGFRLGVNVVNNTPNIYGTGVYNISRQEIGLRNSLTGIKKNIL